MADKLNVAITDRFFFIVGTPESEPAIRSISYAFASAQTVSKE
jgi:hypothetical protein